MNFFKKIFQKDASEDLEIDEHGSIKACIALMLETSMADDLLDESEIKTLKATLINDFKLEETEIDELIEISKKMSMIQHPYTILQEI